MIQGEGSQKRKGQVQMQRGYELVRSYSRLGVRLITEEGTEGNFGGKAQTPADKWILHNDNAPSHGTLRVRAILSKKSITKMDLPLYSPDLGTCDFWPLPRLRNALKEQRFADIADIQRNVTTLL
jgi:hypothetical protein